MIAKCTKCHHEWQAIREPGSCDWCGAPGRKIGSDYADDSSFFDFVKWRVSDPTAF